MNEDKIEEGMLLTQEGTLLNRIDIQTILQLLVEKGIVTSEEINQKRVCMSRQSEYKDSLDGIHKMQQRNYESRKFNETWERVLNNTASDKERECILKELDHLTKN